jgi:hypothetical protein
MEGVSLAIKHYGENFGGYKLFHSSSIPFYVHLLYSWNGTICSQSQIFGRRDPRSRKWREYKLEL